MTMAKKDQVSNFNRYSCYFWLAYYDTNYEYPSIETYIYLGDAIELNEKFPTTEGHLYFQDAESYVYNNSSNSKGHKQEPGRIWEISENEANEKLLDFGGLILELEKCKIRLNRN